MLQNPTKSSPPNLGLGREQKVEYPPELLKEFEGTPGGYAWMSPKNPALLDYLGAEFILIGADPDIGAYISQGHYQASIEGAAVSTSRCHGWVAPRPAVHCLFAISLDTSDVVRTPVHLTCTANMVWLHT